MVTGGSTGNSKPKGSPSAPSWSGLVCCEQGLVACQPRPFRAPTTDGGPHALPDLLDRDFSAEVPGAKMVGDLTYISTWQGWMYLAVVIDCASRAVIGWAIDRHYKTTLVQRAIRMAADRVNLPDGAIFHSDRGSNDTSGEFAATLAELGIRQSVGSTGDCYDNAVAESFFATLKKERVHRTVYDTRSRAAQDIARYIELFYNQIRRHSTLDYDKPNEVLWRLKQTRRKQAQAA